MGYRLGIDIGITSVGWGIVDEDGNVRSAGVRLFREAVKDENVSRRVKRGMRRRIRRRKHRLERVRALLVGNHIIPNDFDFSTSHKITPYQIRVKGLTQELTKQEVAIALYHLAKRRGMHTLDGIVVKEEVPDETLSTKAIIGQTKQELDTGGKYICELQLERFQTEDAKIRGTKNRFMTEHYEKECMQILKTQQKYLPEITDEFIYTYLNIMSSRREYFIGPGKGSPYGWKNTEEWMDKLVGRCSYFPEERRIVKRAYTAELFNLLNDLNNIKVKGMHLTKSQKEDIIENVFKKQKTISTATVKTILTRLDATIDDLSGHRKNKKGEPEFTELIGYFSIAKVSEQAGVIINLNDRNTLDEIARILTYYQTKSHAKDHLIQELQLNDKTAEVLSDILEEKQNPFIGTHALSKKAINLIWDDLWETDKNQMQLFSEMGLRAHRLKGLSRCSRIPSVFVDEWILSPVVRRAIKQSIKVINDIIDKYGYPENITVELAREKNSDDQKKFINRTQKENETINQQVWEILKSNKLNRRLFEKVKLWLLQDGKCMYSLRDISLDDLISHDQNFEIDHIIPRSVSFDNSSSNKVLVYLSENQGKGNRTPYQYLKSGQGHITYKEFKTYVLATKDKKKMPDRKKSNLLFEEDIQKWDVQKEFINRNLVDTRYATREMLSLLRAYFKDQDVSIKVNSINGSFTNFLRGMWNIPKNRDEYLHHAVDALIIAMSNAVLQNFDSVMKYRLHGEGKEAVDLTTGEILKEDAFESKIRAYIFAGLNIKRFSAFKYSHMIDKKPNRQFTNDTLYSTRHYDGSDYVINKITDIYDKDNKKVMEFFRDTKKKESLLMYRYDPKTFEQMTAIFEQYGGGSGKVNPFYTYRQEFGSIRKYSKNGDGPEIKSLKYVGNKLESHLDLSHKYPISPKKKVIMLSQKPYRADIYCDGNSYRFVTIRYAMLKDQGKYYRLDVQLYAKSKERKNISDQYQFIFSLCRGDIIEVNGEKLKFLGVNDDKKNVIECDLISRSYKANAKNGQGSTQLRKTIGRECKTLTKIYTNSIGDEFPCECERLQTIIKK